MTGVQTCALPIRSEERRVGKFFFFQAEDGIRDADVTGVQTCALPILPVPRQINRDRINPERENRPIKRVRVQPDTVQEQIGRASCRERV